MKTKHEVFPVKHLIVMDASGSLDLDASKVALKKLAADPDFDSRSEILLDLRDVECHMSTADIYDLAITMALPNPALPTCKKIAVLVEGRAEFDHAKFLETCGVNRGMWIAAFDDYDKADEWLTADLPEDPREE